MGIFKLNGIDYMGGGGGGNTNYEELTQLEYDALTEEEKNNGTIYFITDTNSNQDGKFQPIIYSENEREIGVWTDGKPLYQKTWTGLNVTIAYNNWTNIIANDFNAETLVAWEALTDNKNITGAGLEIQLTSSYISGEYNASANIRAIKTLTLVYTKTTDTPGSGSWTPGGTPALHYSTDEQIVGTWIDGNTLYEKTFVFSYSDWQNKLENNTKMSFELWLPQINYDKFTYLDGYITANNVSMIHNPINYPNGSTYVRTNIQRNSTANNGYPFIYVDMTYSSQSYYDNRSSIVITVTIRYTKSTD